jgi:hypothetical protein
MGSTKKNVPCVICNPGEAEPEEYCDRHTEQLHQLDHRYETLFRLHRISRGKGHEAYHLFLQGQCDPCGRVLVYETDPENISVTILVAASVDIDAEIQEYRDLGIDRTYADQLRLRVEEVIHSWYGNSRACLDVYRITSDQPEHWDIARREEEEGDEESAEPHEPRSPGGKHSIH